MSAPSAKGPGPLEGAPTLRVPARPGGAPWRLGQVLPARVLGRTPEGALRLEVGGRALTARSALALPAGARLRLQVAATGDPVLLRLLDGGGPPAGGPAAALGPLLRRLAAGPGPWGRRLEALAAALARGPASDPAGPGGAPGAAWSALLRLLRPGPELARPRALADAVARSGLFLHRELAAGRAPVEDLQAALLRLLAALPAGPEEPARAAAEAALGALQARQALAAAGGPWLVVLPWPEGEGWRELRLALAREGEDPGDGGEGGAEPRRERGRRWRARLELDLGPAGPFVAELGLALGPPPSLSLALWCPRRPTAARTRAALPALREGLAAAGLALGSWAVHAAPPPPGPFPGEGWDPRWPDGARRGSPCLLEERA